MLRRKKYYSPKMDINNLEKLDVLVLSNVGEISNGETLYKDIFD